MAELDFDPEAYELVSRIESDPAKAIEALAVVAQLLRDRKPIPPQLADWLADAFEVTAAKDQKERAHALAHELGLIARNRRPSANWIHVAMDIENWLWDNPQRSLNDAFRAVGKEYNLTRSTVQRYYDRFKKIPDNVKNPSN